MAINRDYLDKPFESYTYEVSREKIREYATALGESDPRYFSDGDDCVAPPTFAACFTITKPFEVIATKPDIGFHPVLVHGSESYEFGDEPIRPGDVLTCTPVFSNLTYRSGNEFLEVTVDCRRADGSLAVTATNTIVFFGSAPAEDQQEASA